MPKLVETATGKTWEVPAEELAEALASGLYNAPDGSQKVPVVLDSGHVGQTTLDELPAYEGQARPETEAEFRTRETGIRLEREHGGLGSEILTGAEGVVDGGTGGLYGMAARKLAPEYNANRAARAQVNPFVSGVGQGLGMIGTAVATGGTGALATAAKATPIGLGMRAGAATSAKLGGGILGTGAGMAVGGAVESIGVTASELSVLEDPITLERAVGALGSNMLLNAALGGGLGIAGKAAVKGVTKAGSAIKEATESFSKQAAVADDLRHLDSAGLRAAKETEEAAIEATRVTERATVADEILTLRQDAKSAKTWLATEDKSLRKVALKADRSFDRLTDNLKGLSQNPRRALDTLQRSEQVLEKIVAGGDALKARVAAEGATEGSERLAAHKAAEDMLARNRGIQAKIEQLYTPPKSDRLTAIQGATDALVSGGKTSLGEKAAMAGGMSMAMGLLPGGAIGAIGSVIAPQLLGKVKDVVIRRLTSVSTESAERTSKALSAFLSTSAKVGRAAPVLATKALSSVQFGPEVKKPKTAGTSTPLLDAYRARSNELTSQVMPGPDGKLLMTPAARAAVADRLAGVAAISPMAADMMETMVARRVEFLASKLPKRPDIIAMQVGPDRWQPSDMAIRTFARYVAAVEDPGAIEERLVDGSVTPEDAEAYAAVYPERLEDLKRQVIERLPELQASLPLARKTSLWVLTGVPIDPAHHPRMLGQLQAAHKLEEGTEGGMQAPMANPQFGSVKSQDATPSQKRAGIT